MTAQSKTPATQKSAPAIKTTDAKDKVLARIKQFQDNGALTVPKDYSPENAVQAAWLHLPEIKDKNDKNALEVCTPNSIASALFEMVVKGLSVVKKQCYFIVYGNELQLTESYFGKLAQVKRMTNVKEVNACIIYEGDKKGFKYEIDTSTGKYKLIEHKTNFDSIDKNKIAGVYAVVSFDDGSTQMMQPMTMVEVRQSWQQGATKGNSPAHKNFPDEMAKRTAINRAIKVLLSSSDDSYLDNSEKPTEDKQPITEFKEVNLEEIENAEVVEEVKQEPKQEEPQQPNDELSFEQSGF